MNFLAHLYLSNGNEELTVGNFLADFIRNRDVPNLPLGVQKGVLLHRKIDSYTDLHPLVKQGTKRLQPFHGKYSPVILDVLYDYVLAKNWKKYSDEPLKKFTNRMYKLLIKRLAIMPLSLQTRLPLMVADDWLFNYGKEKGLRYTFERMKRRTSYPQYLDGAVDNLFKNYDLFEFEFNQFFPQVIEYVNLEID
jgi:acyl carrier protein phosphodiesterase